MVDTRPKFLNSVTEHPDVQRLIKQVIRSDEENKQLQAEKKKLKTIIQNALVSLAIINMPCAEDNLANVATNDDLLKIMADSFREALK